MSLLLPRKGLAMPRRDVAIERPAPSAVSVTSDDFLTPRQIRHQIDSMPKRAMEIEPAGWRLSVLVLTTPEQTEGGVLLIDEERERRSVTSPQGIVLRLGRGAYAPTSPDDERFKISGPWCKTGDRVLFQRYGGRVVRLHNGQALAILLDSDISGVIDSGWLEAADETRTTPGDHINV